MTFIRSIMMRVSLTVVLLWSATLSFIHAAQPQVADIKPFGEGFVIAYSDGKLCFTDIDGITLDSIRLRTDVAGIDVRDDYVIAVTPDCAVYKAGRNGSVSRLCRSQMNNSAERVVGISCSGQKIFILTAGGTILSTDDECRSFTSLDFNGTYFLYYEYTRFSAVCASDNAVFIAGTYDDGTPAVYTSTAGNIWSERTLTYTESGQTLSLVHRPLSMAYDARMDRFVLGCTDGYVFYIPGCSHCNSIERKSTDDIKALAFNSGYSIFK